MECIVSRNDLPVSESALRDQVWYHLWQNRQWPYKELLFSDTIYWFDTDSRRIVWKSNVSKIVKFTYPNKGFIGDRLAAEFGEADTKHPYFRQAPEKGYCLAWQVTPVQQMNKEVAADLRMPQLGWLRVDPTIAAQWLAQPAGDDITLDDLAPEGSLLEKIRHINETMKGVSPERVRTVVESTLRRDSKMVNALKELCRYRCQFPGCEARIPTKRGGLYVEVAHIRPVKRGGRSVLGNLLVLCPNHHKEFDHGDLKITAQSQRNIEGKLNGTSFRIPLPGAADEIHP